MQFFFVLFLKKPDTSHCRTMSENGKILNNTGEKEVNERTFSRVSWFLRCVVIFFLSSSVIVHFHFHPAAAHTHLHPFWHILTYGERGAAYEKKSNFNISSFFALIKKSVTITVIFTHIQRDKQFAAAVHECMRAVSLSHFFFFNCMLLSV